MLWTWKCYFVSLTSTIMISTIQQWNLIWGHNNFASNNSAGSLGNFGSISQRVTADEENYPSQSLHCFSSRVEPLWQNGLKFGKRMPFVILIIQQWVFIRIISYLVSRRLFLWLTTGHDVSSFNSLEINKTKR